LSTSPLGAKIHWWFRSVEQLKQHNGLLLG
jgi:hypothetical protein